MRCDPRMVVESPNLICGDTAVQWAGLHCAEHGSHVSVRLIGLEYRGEHYQLSGIGDPAELRRWIVQLAQAAEWLEAEKR